jgi:long-subunit fatty acid transport protein
VTTKQQGYGNEFSTDHGSGEWDFSYGLNISNMVFLGVGVNAVSLHYTESTLFNDGQYGDEETSYDIDGNGWNVKAGVIVKPADFMRLNLAFQSPTWYSLNEDNIYPEYGSDAKGSYMQQKEIDDIEYDLQTPLKFNGGVGFVIDKLAIIGIDYIYQDYTAMREKDDKGQFRNIKNDINKVMKATNTIKVGAEFQLGSGFALRGGLAYVTSPTKDLSRSYLLTKDEDHSVVLPKEATYYTLGFGYAGKCFYTDLAYIHKSQKEDFYEWMNSADIKDPISQTEDTNDIMLTLGLRF